jgi:hypothetical protein
MNDQRRGKIGQIPRFIRDELNTRLDDGQDANQILPWLNGLPTVRELLARLFDGASITKQNLSAWRQGGFKEWLFFQQFIDSAEAMRDNAEELHERFGSDGSDTLPRKLVDSLLTHVTARMAGSIAAWQGSEPSPEMEVLLKMSQYIVKLQRALCQTELHDANMRQRKRAEERSLGHFLDAGLTVSDYLQYMGLKSPQKTKPAEQAPKRAKKKAANRPSSPESQSKPVQAGQGSQHNQAAPPKSTEPPIVENVTATTDTQIKSSPPLTSQPPGPARVRNENALIA